MDEHVQPAVGRLVGLDVSEEMTSRASERNPSVEYLVSRSPTLPLEDATFDVAFASCVLHHVPRDERAHLVAEMARVVRPGGLVIVLEHNPLNPATRLVVARCEFDEDAVLLRMRETRELLSEAGLEERERAYILFLPRRNTIERRLARLPLGAQYYVASSA